MKYIQKKASPNSLEEDKKITQEFGGLGESKKDIQQSLLEEQGYICAYCMQRISTDWNNETNTPRIGIEHYLSRELHPQKQLDYDNMLGVCNGGIQKENPTTKFAHCDKTIGGKVDGKILLHTLNPLDKSKSEDLISYQKGGKIVSKFQNPDVENDINIILNLNENRLEGYRKDALDKIRQDFIKKHEAKKGSWTKKMFQKEIDKLNTKNKEGKYKEYVGLLIWFFEDKKQKCKK